jgi:hypothetical protein
MNVTSEMLRAARRAEYDYFQKGRREGDGETWFKPTPDAVIEAMLKAALATVELPVAPAEERPMPRIVTAAPRRKR